MAIPTVQEILSSIEEKVTTEARNPNLLYDEVKKLGVTMMLSGRLDRRTLEQFCSDLIGLYLKLQNS